MFVLGRGCVGGYTRASLQAMWASEAGGRECGRAFKVCRTVDIARWGLNISGLVWASI